MPRALFSWLLILKAELCVAVDNTNGEETYGGGRYIDLTIPEGDTLIIDFNKAYNPYCVYNKKYSCPLVPRQNYLRTKVRAGVKNFNKD